MSTYEQTAREKWLFNYPAQVLSLYCNLRNADVQVSLAGTQVWWTSEVLFPAALLFFNLHTLPPAFSLSTSNHTCNILEPGVLSVLTAGGGSRELAEGLLQEADCSAQQPHLLALGQSEQRRQTESRNI